MHASLHQWLQCWLVQQCWLAGYRLRAHLFTMSLAYTTTNILCAATDVGMHGLLASCDHQKSKNLRSLQAVTSVILWKLCITIMDELSDFNIHKPVKRFQMKSNGCRDVQHTGLQSTQTRRNTGKQGAQTRGTQHIFPSIPTSVAAVHV